MKKSTEWLFFLLCYATMYATDYIIRSVYHFKASDPIYRRAGMLVAAIFILGYLLYLWRADLAGFLKRVLIAVPFALIFTIFMRMMGLSLLFGLPMYGLLLFKTPSWKQHFSVVLVLASILTITLKFSYVVLNPHVPEGMSIYRTLFPSISIVFIVFFYGLYMRKVEDGETIDLHAIFVRILKFVAAFSLYFSVWLTFEVIGKRQQISVPIGLMVSGVLTIVFLVICYLFDLFPIERKKKIKKQGRLSELQDELTDLYQGESRKLKMYKREQ